MLLDVRISNYVCFSYKDYYATMPEHNYTMSLRQNSSKQATLNETSREYPLPEVANVLLMCQSNKLLMSKYGFRLYMARYFHISTYLADRDRNVHIIIDIPRSSNSLKRLINC
ncbi:hypothetical protein GQX74_006434 [Glossina fuscipes]|nr:hypothetical protein GQX74_006434 [Glossina fuscipes]